MIRAERPWSRAADPVEPLPNIALGISDIKRMGENPEALNQPRIQFGNGPRIPVAIAVRWFRDLTERQFENGGEACAVAVPVKRLYACLADRLHPCP